MLPKVLSIRGGKIAHRTLVFASSFGEILETLENDPRFGIILILIVVVSADDSIVEQLELLLIGQMIEMRVFLAQMLLDAAVTPLRLLLVNLALQIHNLRLEARESVQVIVGVLVIGLDVGP